ncbi:MAG: hypothetical protein OQK12_08355 [Motiliproteus sp.]|nr:hypothetical protein [Motiliproteus sp.]MCW9053487.1 hypothetical protein [Motiliproteus sp.]
MARSYISEMLDAWDHHVIEHRPKSHRKVALPKDDLARLEALAQVYQLPIDDIIANLISSSLKEVEERIPYVAGPTVIRIEEGEPIYEDCGHMPAYLQAKGRLERKAS